VRVITASRFVMPACAGARYGLEYSPTLDAIALASAISSAAAGLTGASVAFYSAHRTAKTAQEGRGGQRAADGYLKMLSLAEQEAQWHDAHVFNLGGDVLDNALMESTIGLFKIELVHPS
jgi:hypothetical protein